MKHEFS